MSEVKFTSEEWVAKQHEPFSEWSVEANHDDEGFFDMICEEVSSKTNAHLIAAAPEMYAMLEEVSKELYNLIDEVNDQRLSHVHASSLTQPDLHDGETIHNIQLLLAKARGE